MERTPPSLIRMHRARHGRDGKPDGGVDAGHYPPQRTAAGDTQIERGASNDQSLAGASTKDARIAELEKFEEVVVGRELKMIQLEKEIRALKNQR